jgi:large subunit ribosomal protein L25
LDFGICVFAIWYFLDMGFVLYFVAHWGNKFKKERIFKMTETRDLVADVREITTKGDLKAMRSNGFMPGIFYGKGVENVNLKLSEKEVKKILHTDAGRNVIINLSIKGEKGEQKETVIPQDVQVNPLTDLVEHIDLRQINLKEAITTAVAVRLIGTAGAVKKGGILVQNLHHVDVKCLPTDIPPHIDIDITILEEIGNVVKVAEIKFPENIEVLHLHPEQTAVAIMSPRKEVEPDPAEAAAEESVEAEVVGGKGKEEAEGEAKADAKPEAKEEPKAE